MLLASLISALICAPPGLQKAFPSVVNLVSESILFPIPFRAPEIVDAVQFFQIISNCSSKGFLAYPAYRRLADIAWEDICFVEWFPYKGGSGDVLSIPELQVRGRN